MEMESHNLIKGYGKVQEEDYQTTTTTTQHTKRPVVSQRVKVILVVSSILLLALLGALTIASFDHESSESPEVDSLSSAESIQAICNVTQYPALCLSSLSSSLNSSSRVDPESVLKLSLQVSIKEVNNLTAFFDTLLAQNGSNGSSGALKDCLELCGEAKGKVQDSLTEMEVVAPGEKVLTPRKVNDIQTWMSAALTDQETCLDGLLETVGGGGEGVNFFSVKSRVENYKEVLSNSLAIVAHMDELLEKFDLTMY